MVGLAASPMGGQCHAQGRQQAGGLGRDAACLRQPLRRRPMICDRRRRFPPACVLANRLSADPMCGWPSSRPAAKTTGIWFHIPVGYLFAIGNPRADWCFKTEPEPGLNGRVLSYPRGKTIGGSSAINAMINMRGQAADYDHWRQLGLPGWGWDDVAPLFKGHEDHFLGPNAHHGKGGEWHVEFPRITWPLLDVVRDAAGQAASPASTTFNTGDNEGASYFHVNQKRGLRWSAARGFLKPVLNRPNLKLITAGHVEKGNQGPPRHRRHLVRPRRAAHPPCPARGDPGRRRARLAATADALRHRAGGASGRAASKWCWTSRAVGSNLQDHLQLRLIYKVSGIGTLNQRYHSLLGRMSMGLEFALLRRGPLTMAPSQMGIFTKSDPNQERANLEFHVQPLSLDKFRRPAAPLPRLHHECLQPAPHLARHHPAEECRSARGAGDRASLSGNGGRPAGGGGFHSRRPPHRGAAGTAALPSRGTSAGPAFPARTTSRSARRRAMWVPPFSTPWHGQDGLASDPQAVVDARCGCSASKACGWWTPPSCPPSPRQHQFADGDDRREGRAHDPGGCPRVTIQRLPLAATDGRRCHLTAGTAGASSPDAWADLFAKAQAACFKASGLKSPRPSASRRTFSDRVLVLVSGRWPQPHMNNAKATFACLYAKGSGSAEAQELMTPP